MQLNFWILILLPELVQIKSEEDHEAGEGIYPLHCLCYNENVSSSIIKLITEQFPDALLEFAPTDLDSGVYSDHPTRGLPLHHYVAKRSNVDIDVVKLMVEICPQSLLTADDNWEYDGEPNYFTPVHVILYNPTINNLLHVLTFLLECEPTLIKTAEIHGRTPLNMACSNERITLHIVKLLYNLWPGAIRSNELNGWLPIHEICHNRKLDQIISLDILRFMIDIDPMLPRERENSNGRGYLPIHHAVGHGAKSKGLLQCPHGCISRTFEGPR